MLDHKYKDCIPNALFCFSRNLWLTPFPRYLLKTIISSFTHSALSSHLMLYCIVDTNCGFKKVSGIISLRSNLSITYKKCMRKVKGLLRITLNVKLDYDIDLKNHKVSIKVQILQYLARFCTQDAE